MGLKRNISVPFDFFYCANNFRFIYFNSINKKSKSHYIYLIKKTIKKIKLFNPITTLKESFYLSNTSPKNMYFSDLCLSLRSPRNAGHRVLSCVQKVDYSISSYNYLFDYSSLEKRSQSF